MIKHLCISIFFIASVAAFAQEPVNPEESKQRKLSRLEEIVVTAEKSLGTSGETGTRLNVEDVKLIEQARAAEQ